MNWKTVALPRSVWVLYKKGRAVKLRLRVWRANKKLQRGKPEVVNHFLSERGLTGRVVLKKQGVLSIATPEGFIRYTKRPKGVRRLNAEVEWWRRLQAAGLSHIIVDNVQLHEFDKSVICEAPLLGSLTEEDQVAATLPILKALHDVAEAKVVDGIPTTIATALALLEEERPYPEIHAAIRVSFSEPLRVGISHQDIHLRNVMKDEQGRSVLIDLKSCIDDQVLALDILNFMCKYHGYRSGRNVIDQALLAHEAGWQDPELECVHDLIDLPKRYWGPIFCFHAIGRVLMKDPKDARTISLMKPILRRVSEVFGPPQLAS